MFKVLIVDDEKIVRLAIKSMIKWGEHGLEFCGTASNGIAALEIVKKSNPDIIITDIKMPEMDGVELIRRLREKGYDGEILVLSNYNDFDLVRDALRYGAHDYVLKVTVNTEDFSRILGEMVEKLRKKHGYNRHVHPRDLSPDMVRNALLKEFLVYSNADIEHTADKLASLYLPEKDNVFLSFVIVSERLRDFSTEDSNRAISIIRNIAGETLSSNIWYSVIEIDSNTVFIAAAYSSMSNSGIPAIFAKKLTELAALYYNKRIGVIYSDIAKDYRTFLKESLKCIKTSSIFFYSRFFGQVLKADFIISEDEQAFSDSIKSLVQKIYDNLLESRLAAINTNFKDFFQLAADKILNPYRLKKYIKKTLREVERKLINDGFAIGEVFDEYTDDEDVIQKAASENDLLETIQSIIKKAEANIDVSEKHQRKEVRDAIRFIKKHACEKITLSDIAAVVNLNETYLCKVFRENTGKSIVSYINEVKMKIAYKLLAEKDFLVKEAAAAVGIEDQFYFNRLFKRYFGITPKEVKKL